MKLSRSSFYYRPKRQSLEYKETEAELRGKIEAICLEFTRYGYRRVTHELRCRGCHVNHKKVFRIMRESDLLCRIKRKRVKTTDSRHRFPRYPNLIKGKTINRLNQVWLSDITYIRIRTGYQNTSGKVFSKVLPIERNGGRYWTIRRTKTFELAFSL